MNKLESKIDEIREEINRPKRILFVDDERTLATAVKMVLSENNNYDIDIAFDGGEAVEAIEKKKYDIVFLDLLMPRMNGYEALPKIIEIDPKVNVILISGVDESAVQSLPGWSLFIRKPAAIEDLKHIVSTLPKRID